MFDRSLTGVGGKVGSWQWAVGKNGIASGIIKIKKNIDPHSVVLKKLAVGNEVMVLALNLP